MVNEPPANKFENDETPEGFSVLETGDGVLPETFRTAEDQGQDRSRFSRPLVAILVVLLLVALGGWMISSQEKVPVPEPVLERTDDERIDDVTRAQTVYRELVALGLDQRIVYPTENGVAVVALGTGEVVEVTEFPAGEPQGEDIRLLAAEETNFAIAIDDPTVVYRSELDPEPERSPMLPDNGSLAAELGDEYQDLDLAAVAVSPDGVWLFVTIIRNLGAGIETTESALIDISQPDSTGTGVFQSGSDGVSVPIWADDSSFVAWLDPKRNEPMLIVWFTDGRPPAMVDLDAIGGPDRKGDRLLVLDG